MSPSHPHELWRQLTRQCFELEQIWDNFYYRNVQFFYCKCGLRFALAQSIAEFSILTAVFVSILTQLCFELEQIRDHIYSRKIAHFYSKSGLRFALAQNIAELIAAKVHVGGVCDTEQKFREELLP